MNQIHISFSVEHFKNPPPKIRLRARYHFTNLNMGVLWIAPHKMIVTSALNVRENQLRLEITNQWTNRLIGDENYPNVSNYNLSMRTMSYGFTANKPPNLCKISAFTVYPFYNKGDELLPAGLKGPVRILSVAEQRLKP